MPNLDPVKNFAKVVVPTGYDAVATSIVLQTGDGAKFPDPLTDGAFNLVWWNSTDYNDPSDDPNKEIVRCIARTIDTLTITRAQEGTIATTKNTASKTYKMILSPTKKLRDDINSAVDFNAQTEKITPIDADILSIEDSIASWAKKKLSWTNLKATLKTYFDTLYSAIGHNHSGVYQPADSDLTDLAAAGRGTAGQVYTSNGAGLAPTWQAAGGATQRAKIYRSTFQTISNGIWTKIQLNAQTYNLGCTVDIITNYRITIDTAGRYQINASIAMNIANSGKQIVVALRKNGIDVGYDQIFSSAAFSVPFVKINDILDLAATDYLELWVYHNDGANADVYASGNDFFNFISIHRIS